MNSRCTQLLAAMRPRPKRWAQTLCPQAPGLCDNPTAMTKATTTTTKTTIATTTTLTKTKKPPSKRALQIKRVQVCPLQ